MTKKRNLSRIIAAAVAIPALAALFTTSTAEAKDTKCSNVDITVANSHPSGDPVKIVYVKYKVGNTWYKEDIADRVPNSGVEVTWNNQDLQSLPEGTSATWRVYFKRQLTGGSIPKYDDTHYQEFSRSKDCQDNGSFKFTVSETGTKGS